MDTDDPLGKSSTAFMTSIFDSGFTPYLATTDV